MHFKIFAEQSIDQLLHEKLLGIKAEIASEDPARLLGLNEEEYLKYLVEKYSQDSLSIDFDHVEASAEERYVEPNAPGRPDLIWGDTRGKYLRQVITYHVPFSGDPWLLRCRPSTWIQWSMPVSTEHGQISISIIDYDNDPKRVATEFEAIKGRIQSQLGHVRQDVESFNSNLYNRAKEGLLPRKQEVSAQLQVLASLGVPIRKAGTIPATFAIPTVRKKVFPKPVASSASPIVTPTPTLDDAIYQDILQTIYDMGKVFERLPSTYAGKNEENLRDHLILQLEPRFEGSTTGETFNKTGKTDILIRHEKGNVFVAECKFWAGKSKHLETIDQLLSYLTWRDSKTAIIYFVNNKQMTPVLEEIRNQTPSHPCFVKPFSEKHFSWQFFEFHLPNDPGCKIKLSILAFHIP